MTEQNIPPADEPKDEAPATGHTSADELNRRQHLAAALRGRPVLRGATAIAALAVGFGGFGIGYAVGNNHEHGDRFSRVVFERGEMPGAPGEFGRGFGGPGDWQNG